MSSDENEIRFYESDSPCRKCGGCTRYRNTKLKGQCANCVSDKSRDEYARNWVETTRRPDNSFRQAERGEGFQKEYPSTSAPYSESPTSPKKR